MAVAGSAQNSTSLTHGTHPKMAANTTLERTAIHSKKTKFVWQNSTIISSAPLRAGLFVSRSSPHHSANQDRRKQQRQEHAPEPPFAFAVFFAFHLSLSISSFKKSRMPVMIA